MSRTRNWCAPFTLGFALSALCSSAAAQMPDKVVPILVAPAAQKAAIAPLASSRAMVLGVPLRNDWKVATQGGRPALSITGAERWQWTTTATWPDGSVRWALARAIVPGAPKPQTGLGFVAGSGVSEGDNLARLLPDGGAFVDTGVLQAEVRTGEAFNVLDKVVVDGTQLVFPGKSRGIVALGVDHEQLRVAPGATLGIAENGPAYALVKVDGTLVDVGDHPVIDFTCRLAFTWGSRDVEVHFTLRNANIEHPQHAILSSVKMRLTVGIGDEPLARFALPDENASLPLQPDGSVLLYQAYSTAPTKDVLGSGTNWVPPITKLHSTGFTQEGLLVMNDDTVVYDGPKDRYPAHEWMDVSGTNGGCTFTIKQMPYFWPASLECTASGFVDCGLFPPLADADYTWSWRQHDSRTAVFSFYTGKAADPVQVSRRIDVPIVGRVADFHHYIDSGCFPYDMLTIDEQNALYQFLGLDHEVDVGNEHLTVTRYLPTHNTGGDNNYDSIECRLASQYLRGGQGGPWMNAMDLALYKAEWQIARSDNFEHTQDPGASNDHVPHTKNIISDEEHRYRGGIVLAWHLSGDERLLDGLKDEAEILPDVYLSPQERSMYQTIVALVEIATELPDAPGLVAALRQRLDFFCTPTIDIDSGEDGFGWDGPPGLGPRGCYVNSDQSTGEKQPGENYVSRGFITASMGPRAMFRAAKFLGATDPDGALARNRLVDLATYTRNELYPYIANPADRHLIYSYGVMQQHVNKWETVDFHPILVGQCEAWHATGDIGYLVKGFEQIQAFKVHDKMEWIDKRLEAQHYLRTIRDLLAGGGP